MATLLWTHLVGFGVLLGAGVSAGIVNRLAALAEDARPLDAAALELAKLADAGLILAFASGIGMTAVEGFSFTLLLHQLWLVLMILGGLLAGALNGFARATTRRLLAGEAAPHARRTITALRIGFLVATLFAIGMGTWRITL